MKRFLKLFFLLAALTVAGTQQADAQIGNLLKKAKKTVEAVTGKTVEEQTVAKVKAVEIPSGGTMENPISSAVELELVGAYGKTTSQNYGTVQLVLKVKMIANKARIGFGGEINGTKTMAVDQDGNSYAQNLLGQYFYDVTEGMFIKVALDHNDLIFKDVKKAAQTMQVIRLGCFVDNNAKGMITFKNVPIQWDVQP